MNVLLWNMQKDYVLALFIDILHMYSSQYIDHTENVKNVSASSIRDHQYLYRDK